MENREALYKIRDTFRSTEPTRTVRATGGFAPKQPKRVPRTGGKCPKCFIVRSVTGVCDCED